MGREPIRIHRSFQTKGMSPLLLWDVSRRFHRLSPRYGNVAHVLRTLSPVAASVLLHRDAPRLACVKPVASVHPEPGSNSSLYDIFNVSLGDLVLSRLVTLLIYSFLQESTVRIFYPVHSNKGHAPLLYYFVCMEKLFKDLTLLLVSSDLGGVPFEKRVQRYRVLFYPPNILVTFFELFLHVFRKRLNYSIV